MTGRVRMKNGRFAKLKVIEKRKKAAAAILAARRKKKEESESKSYVCEGNRIINLQELGKNLKCCKCQEVLSLEKITDETREGLHSTLKIDCSKCETKNAVFTGKKIKSNGHTFSDVNLTAVLGSIYSGIGCTSLNKIFACLDMPVITMDLYKRYEREVGPAIEKVAIESCKKAVTEERQLVIQNLKELCKNL